MRMPALYIILCSAFMWGCGDAPTANTEHEGVERVGRSSQVTPGSGGQAQPLPPIRDEASLCRILPSEIGAEVEFSLSPGRTIVLTYPPNHYHVNDFALYLGTDGLIWFDYGEITAKNAGRLMGSLEQIGHAPLAAVVQWEPEGDGLRVVLNLTDDRQVIADIVASIRSGELNWALRLPTLDLVASQDLSEVERIAGFARLWSEVKYNFAFFNQIPDIDWDAVLADYLPRVQQAESAGAYYDVLRECMALLRDGHTEVRGPSDRPTATIPIRLAKVEGRAIVVAIAEPDALHHQQTRRELQAAKLTVGDELLKLDGTPVSEVLRTRIEPFISASTPQHLAVQSYPRILQGERDSSVRLRLRSVSGNEREAILTRGYARLPGFALTRPNGPIHDGVYYVAIDSFAGDRSVQQFEKMLPEIRAARGLILDLRENSGGSTSNANRILSHLTDKPLAGSRWRTRQYRPAFHAWGHSEEWHEGSHDPVRPAQGAFLGPVVVLTGPRTISAAEDFLVVLKASGRARLVGERTAGSTGQPLIVHLPAGGIARICTKRDTYPDGSDFVGVGVIPDVEVAPTVADIVAGRDTILDRGLAELGELMNQ